MKIPKCVAALIEAACEVLKVQHREVERLRDEVARLKAGRFTEEELQALCHEQGEGCPERFARECLAFNRKLFGDRQWLMLKNPVPIVSTVPPVNPDDYPPEED